MATHYREFDEVVNMNGNSGEYLVKYLGALLAPSLVGGLLAPSLAW